MSYCPKVYSWRSGIKNIPATAINVDRRSIYGNPFRIGIDGNRNEVINKFEQWIAQPEQIWLVQHAQYELRGYDLVCWCAPQRCHADVWIRIVNKIESS